MPILKTSIEIRAERDRLLELANDPDPLISFAAKVVCGTLSWALGERADVPLDRLAAQIRQWPFKS